MNPSPPRCSGRCAIPKAVGRKVAHVQKLGKGEGDGCVVGLGKRLGDFGPKHAKKVVAPRAGTVQKEEPFGLQVLDCWYAL